MNLPWFGSTPWSVSLHQGLQFCFLILFPLKINKVCILLWYLQKLFSIGKFLFWTLTYHPTLCNLYNPVCCILLSFFVFSPDSIHQSLHCRIQFICTMHFHYSIILSIVWHTWKQPHHLIAPDIEWMGSCCSCDLKFESNFCIHCNLPAPTVVSLLLTELIKNPKTPCTVGELAVAWWFRSGCLGMIWHDVDIPLVFVLINTAVQILVGEICIFDMLQINQFEISSMCHLIDDSPEGLCHCRHCTHHDWFKG